MSAFAGMDSTLYCGGWVDLYYLPKAFWFAWSKAVEIIYKNLLVNEIGVVLAWRAMFQSGDAFQGGSLWNMFLLVFHAWGSCLKQAACTPAY